MDKMVTSFPCLTIILTAFLHCCNGSNAIKGVQMCQVVKLDMSSTYQNEHMTMIKFDFILLPPVSDSISFDNEFTTKTENIPVDNVNQTTTGNDFSPTTVTISSQNISTTTPKQQYYTSQDDPGQDNTSCNCRFSSNTTTTISMLKVWPDSCKFLHLEVKEVHPPIQPIPINKALNHTFNNTKITLSVTNNTCLQSYSFFLLVQGDIDNVKCSEPLVMFTNETAAWVLESVTTDAVIKSNTELLFEMPLLLIGAVLAVIGFLLLMAGIAVWRRYIKERGKIKDPANVEMTEFPQDNYEVIFNDASGNSKTTPKKETQNFLRTVSSSSTPDMKYKHDDALFSRSQSLGVTDTLGSHLGTKVPSPGTTKHKKRSFINVKKEKHHKTSKKKENKRYNGDDDEQTYSSVQLEDEDDLPQVSTARNQRVATPLLLLLNSDTKQKPLKTRENWRESQIKAMSMPRMELPSEVNVYSHLNQAGKSHSYHLTDEPIYEYDDTNDNRTRCKSADLVRNSVNPFTFPTESSHQAKGMEVKNTEDEGRKARVSSNTDTDEQDHIYEAVEMEVETAKKKKLQLSQGNEQFTEISKSENASNSVNGVQKVTEVVQSNSVAKDDLCEPMVGNEIAGTQSVRSCITGETVENKHDTVTASECVSVDEADDTEDVRLSTTIEIIDVKKLVNRDQQHVQISPTKQKDQSDVTNNTKTNTRSDDSISGNESTEVLPSKTLNNSDAKSLNNTTSDRKTVVIFDKEVDTKKDRAANEGLEGYTIIENILYESVTLSEPAAVGYTSPN